VYSESLFERFKEKVLKEAEDLARQKIEEGETVYRQMIEQAEEKGKEVYEREIKEFTAYLKREKERKIAQIRKELVKKESEELRSFVNNVQKRLEVRLSQEFEALVECFSRWLREKYRSGKVYTPEKWGDLFEGFERQFIKEDKVIFQKGPLQIVFSIDTLLEEYRDRIATMVISQIRV